MVILQSQLDLDEYAEDNEDFAIYFYADWCGPCFYVNKAIDRWGNETKTHSIAKVNIDKCEVLREFFDIENIPCFLFIKKGEISDRFEGADCNRLKKKFDAFFNTK